MFSPEESGAAAPAAYQVLARKYRPKLFGDLIGQEAMVRTLSNAFSTGRIAHGFMLTGVRGVGKTTTARLLARALNYQSDDHDGPSMDLSPPGIHCEAISKGRHPDVLELDAATNSKVDQMRDMLDGVRYAPISARYKVYILDEVHMLSTAAFNALLKTLEEPPEHAVFVFATTEIRKVPVTVLSRCQRFDLRRLESPVLAAHLGRVATAEGLSVSEEGLAVLARAAEGSVRDGLSLLDQALVQAAAEGETDVSADAVRDMLGLADRTRLLDLFADAVSGDAKAALEGLDAQLADGAAPIEVLKELIGISADIAAVQAAGEAYASDQPADWRARLSELAARLSPAQSARAWQILLHGHRDAALSPEIATGARMVVLRLAAALALPSPEEAARTLGGAAGAEASEGKGAAPPGKPEGAAPGGPAPTAAPGEHDPAGREAEPKPKPGLEPEPRPRPAAMAAPSAAYDDIADDDVPDVPDTLAGIAELLARKREMILLGEVERHLRPVREGPGYLRAALEPSAPADLLGRMADILRDATGADWQIEAASPQEESGRTLREEAARLQELRLEAARRDPKVAEALRVLPGARLVSATGPLPPDAARADPAGGAGVDPAAAPPDAPDPNSPSSETDP